MDTIEIVRTTYDGRYIERDLNGNVVFVWFGGSEMEWHTWTVFSNDKCVAKFRVKRLRY